MLVRESLKRNNKFMRPEVSIKFFRKRKISLYVRMGNIEILKS